MHVLSVLEPSAAEVNACAVAAKYVPAAQSTHVLSVLEPSVTPYLPGPQLSHSPCPTLS
jgi:hypothetical protein